MTYTLADAPTRRMHDAMLAAGYQYLDHGHYRVSDKTAGKLALAARRSTGAFLGERYRGRHCLPAWGRELMVTLPCGRKAWLMRTQRPYYVAVKRAWVWAVLPICS